MTRRLTGGLLTALGFLSTVGPFAADMYLASFTDIARDLGGPASSVQLTLTAFLLGIGTGQLVLGPASDRFGRRPVLVAALAVFAASSIAMVFSPTLAVFIALRAVQGLSGAAGVVVSRAIAVDLSEGETAVRALSLMATVVGLGPLLAPPVGGAVAEVWGWRAVLAVLAAIATAMFLLAALAVPESLPRTQRHSGGVGSMFARFGTLLADRRYTGYLVAFACAFGAMMSYISASPFVGQRVLHMSPVEYSLGFAAGAAALISANLVNARVAGRVGPRRMLVLGVVTTLVAGVALAVLASTGTLSIATFIVCAFTLTAGTGFTMSNASALALARADAARGSGAALLGASQFFVGGLASPLVGLWGEHTAVPMAVIALVFAVAACTAAAAAGRSRR
ncbi:multidrug effflux MFS transporter [Microbacterium luticocti]|uniref:multidrug effflux MFS transporter n=1 Tax=Microbacterium luticocti TaxID=451764 RepID=UPI00040CD2A9|nr:multidrug effflux MFS transporter [Microbacterium luticocti]